MIIITIIDIIYYVLLLLFLARMIVSFARIDPYDPTWGRIANGIYRVTEPIMEPVRRILPPQGGLDLSPLIILIGLIILRRLLIGILL
jgi:YggT family protein